MRELGIPVDDREGLLFLSTLGVGGGGSAVDLFAHLPGALAREKLSVLVRLSTPAADHADIRVVVADEAGDGGVADDISDRGFRNPATDGGQPVTSGCPNPTIAGLDQRRYHAQATILNFDMRLLPIYLVPTKMSQVDSSWEYDRDAGIIYSGRQTTRGKKYSFDYMHTDFTPEALRTVGPLSPNDPIQKKFTALPSQTAQVDATVKQQAKDARTPYDKVIAIFNFFSRANRFTYSQQTKVGTSGSDIVDFLTNRQGFCEQYSAAMAWLVRAAGIPARVAFGFTKGSAQKGSTYTLTNLNLHAWTEVYFERFGWVPFDPTPATAIAGSVSTPWAPHPNLPSTGQTGQNDDPRTGQNPAAGPSAS